LASWEEAEILDNCEDIEGFDHISSDISIPKVEPPPNLQEPEDFGQFYWSVDFLR
jgi:hypothetical protein